MGEQQAVGEAAPWALGCQARPWAIAWGPEAFAARLPEVMSRVAGHGFTGFETRLAFLPLAEPGPFVEAVAAHGVALCGAHVGGRWWAPEGAAAIPDLVRQARALPGLGCRRLVVSMAPLPVGAGDADHARMVATLDRLGRACRDEAGVGIVLHNHAGELVDDAGILRELIAGCAPDAVALAPDLGWVARTGMDIEAFLRRFGDQIAYLHLRDVTAPDPTGELVEVGRGVLDYPAILRTLAALDYRGWLVVESEFERDSTVDPDETTQLQGEGLRAALTAAGLLGRIGPTPEPAGVS